MKFGPITTTIIVVLLLWTVLPSFEVTVGDFVIYIDTVFAFFIGGLAGGLRFTYLKSRRMTPRETAFHAVFSYVITMALPLVLLFGMLNFAREITEVAEMLERHIPATDVFTFLLAYFSVDAGPSILALFAALFATQMRPAPA